MIGAGTVKSARSGISVSLDSGFMVVLRTTGRSHSIRPDSAVIYSQFKKARERGFQTAPAGAARDLFPHGCALRVLFILFGASCRQDFQVNPAGYTPGKPIHIAVMLLRSVIA